VVFGPTDTISLDWTLRPPDDAVQNGGFESGLAGWSVSSGQEGTPVLVAAPLHTGRGAVALGGDAVPGSTTVMSQTIALSGSWEPALAFWYKPVGVAPYGDAFRVVLTVRTEMPDHAPGPAIMAGFRSGGDRRDGVTEVRNYVLTPSLEATDWQHVSLSLAAGGTFTGTVAVQFEMRNGDPATATVYLDEVSLGRTPGGPHKSYLPVTMLGH
jgi:hypothetical protein